MADFDNLVNIQRNIASRISQEIQMDDTLALLEIVQGLVPDKFGRVQKELVIFEAVQNGMSEPNVIRLIDQLVRDGTLKENGEYLTL